MTYFNNAIKLGEWLVEAIDGGATDDQIDLRVDGSEGFGQQYDMTICDITTGVEYQVTVMRVSNANHGINECPAGCEFYATDEDRDDMEAHLRDEHDWDEEQLEEYFGS